jgi:hypothetical protein
MRSLALLLLLAASCASNGKEATVRELPVGMRTLGALLDGCTPEADGDITRAVCAGDVVLAMQSRHAIIGEPHYRTEAYALAQQSGARLVWDQIVVPTEGPSGVLDRARAMTPLNDTPAGLLLGVVRALEGRDVQEIWCTAKDDAGDRRCRDLIGAVLGGHTDEQPKVGAATATPKVVKSNGPVTLFGRSVSLPTSCSAKMLAEGADASCEDGASASWRKFETMEEATETVTSTLAALGSEVEPEPFNCVVGGETAQCEDHETAVAGLTYIDGKPVGVLCLAPMEHALCKALIHPK